MLYNSAPKLAQPLNLLGKKMSIKNKSKSMNFKSELKKKHSKKDDNEEESDDNENEEVLRNEIGRWEYC